MSNYNLHNGDCLEVLKNFEDNSIDSVVTDPPYGLSATPDISEVMKNWIAGTKYDHKASGFMGKSWDSFVPNPDIWKEVYRVMKPGATALVFAGSRTQDLMSISLRFAGFEIRDTIMWLYGSGFPKSLNIAKTMNKFLRTGNASWNGTGDSSNGALGYHKLQHEHGYRPNDYSNTHKNKEEVTEDEAKLWNGYGTALKPAYEPIIIAMKPLDKNFVNNALKHGVAGLNIDGSRIGISPGYKYNADKNGTIFHGETGERIRRTSEKNGQQFIESSKGRFPANILLDEESAKALDDQSGIRDGKRDGTKTDGCVSSSGFNGGKLEKIIKHGDTGGASRFFYVAKTSTSERNIGCENMTEQQVNDGRETSIDNAFQRGDTMRKNIHPTVKPIKLMQYLCNLVKTPTGGVVLDPFMGSGSTGMACANTGQQFVGIELSPEYFQIAKARIETSHKEKSEVTPSIENIFNE